MKFGIIPSTYFCYWVQSFAKMKEIKIRREYFIIIFLLFFCNKLPTFEMLFFLKITYSPQFDFDLSLVAFKKLVIKII
jgi:hypothetical protein